MYWYQENIQWLEKIEVKKTKLKKVVFFGSSTFTLWENMEKDFSKFLAINVGFGGSTLAACAWFYDRIVPRHKPDVIFIYAGDNDLSDGRTPEEVVLFYYQLIAAIRKSVGKIPICYISIKLSPSREYLKESIKYVNYCISEFIKSEKKDTHLYFLDLYSKMLLENASIDNSLYQADGLHLSSKGYLILKNEIDVKYSEIFPE